MMHHENRWLDKRLVSYIKSYVISCNKHMLLNMWNVICSYSQSSETVTLWCHFYRKIEIFSYNLMFTMNKLKIQLSHNDTKSSKKLILKHSGLFGLSFKYGYVLALASSIFTSAQGPLQRSLLNCLTMEQPLYGVCFDNLWKRCVDPTRQ